MQLRTVLDIVGDNTAHPLSVIPQGARWVILGGIGGSFRLGDMNVSANRGASVTSAVLPLDGVVHSFYDLSLVWVYVPTGVTVSISWG